MTQTRSEFTGPKLPSFTSSDSWAGNHLRWMIVFWAEQTNKLVWFDIMTVHVYLPWLEKLKLAPITIDRSGFSKWA